MLSLGRSLLASILVLPACSGGDAAAPTPDASDAAPQTDAGVTRLCDGYQLLTNPSDFTVTALAASGGSCTFDTPFAGTVDCHVDASTSQPSNHAEVAITVPSSSDFCVTFDMQYVGSPSLTSLMPLYSAQGVYTGGTTQQLIEAIDTNGARYYGDNFSQTYATASLQDPISGDARIAKDTQDLTAPQVRLYTAGATSIALTLGSYQTFGAPNGTLTSMQVVLGTEQDSFASSGPALELKFTNVKVFKK